MKCIYVFCTHVRWYPPGHGDFYESFQNSGLLQKFIASVSCILLSFFIAYLPICN